MSVPTSRDCKTSAGWRLARASDDREVVEMCLALYDEDPGLRPLEAARVLRTLATFRAEPWRGRAAVLALADTPEREGAVSPALGGYALLVPFWSNEYGGNLCEVDELFIRRALRGQSLGSSLFVALEQGQLWDEAFVGIALLVTDGNARARALYERLGFVRMGTSWVRAREL